jgi:hypothetical protein
VLGINLESAGLVTAAVVVSVLLAIAVLTIGMPWRTFTRSRHGFAMISEYVSYAPPTNVGMKMVRGPWFFAMMAGGWRFDPADEPGHTRATWRYNFRCRPALLRPAAERIGVWVLGRDIRRRIAGYARGCTDPVVLAAARPPTQ